MNRRFDQIITGVITGTVLPLLVFLTLHMVLLELTRRGIITGENRADDFRIRTISLVSIGANVILVRYFQNRYAYQAVRGVVFPTFIYIIGWIIYFSSFLMQ